MNDKQAKDSALSSSPSTQPKSFIAKEYISPPKPTTTEHHQPRSPGINPKEDDTSSIKKESPDSSKPSPSNKSFLNNLKNFNLDRSRYKHYGYQSSMTSQQLEKIVDEANNANPNNEATPPKDGGVVSSNRLVIDEKISQILGLPQQVVDEDEFWPYTVETLNEILRYKIEQEKTRQETIKNEFGYTAVEILKLAKEMNISGDLVPYLFVSDSANIKEKIHKLKSEPEVVLGDILAKSKEKPIEIQKISKRKYSDTQLPSFSETAESIKTQSTIVSPLRSPNKSPITTHRRVVSDSSEVTNRGSNTTSPPNYSQLPLPPSSHAPQHRSQQHSPQIPPQPGMYPVYYSPGPQGPGQAPYPHHQQMGPPPSGQPQEQQKGLGSPYSQKYNHVVFDGSNQQQVPPGAQSQAQYQGGPGYMQQPHYQYFNNPPGVAPPSQYMMQQMVVHPPHQQHQQVPSHTFQSPPEAASKSSTGSHDDSSPHKKHKATKTNNINFMITTPKNPPARKYNNPNKEK